MGYRRRREEPRPGKPIARDRLYCYVTWITSLLSAENVCRWRAWFRTHFRAVKNEDDDREVELEQWSSEHNALVERDQVALFEEGWAVYRESQNKFTVGGQVVDFQGKPDLVAQRGDRVLIIDRKTGRRRRSDIWQVMIYMYWLTTEFVEHPAMVRIVPSNITGEIRYSDGAPPVVIKFEDFTLEMIRRMKAEIKAAASEDEPPRAPSVDECRYCDVSAADCPARIEVPEEIQVVKKTEDF